MKITLPVFLLDPPLIENTFTSIKVKCIIHQPSYIRFLSVPHCQTIQLNNAVTSHIRADCPAQNLLCHRLWSRKTVKTQKSGCNHTSKTFSLLKTYYFRSKNTLPLICNAPKNLTLEPPLEHKIEK